MRISSALASGALALMGGILLGQPTSLADQNEALFRQLHLVHRLSEDQVGAVRKIFAKSGYMGQGNPAIARHPVTPEECQAKLKQQSINYENPRFERICGGKYMAPLYDPATQQPEDSKACIDQFEFTDIPCIYPVVWVKAREAAEICWAIGKRLCDAHEWEGACAGSLDPPDYRFDLARGSRPNAAIDRMRLAHNQLTVAKKTGAMVPRTKRNLRHFQSEEFRVRRRGLDKMRLQYFSRGRLP
jgi:hypothetical protein